MGWLEMEAVQAANDGLMVPQPDFQVCCKCDFAIQKEPHAISQPLMYNLI